MKFLACLHTGLLFPAQEVAAGLGIEKKPTSNEKTKSMSHVSSFLKVSYAHQSILQTEFSSFAPQKTFSAFSYLQLTWYLNIYNSTIDNKLMHLSVQMFASFNTERMNGRILKLQLGYYNEISWAESLQYVLVLSAIYSSVIWVKAIWLLEKMSNHSKYKCKEQQRQRKQQKQVNKKRWDLPVSNDILAKYTPSIINIWAGSVKHSRTMTLNREMLQWGLRAAGSHFSLIVTILNFFVERSRNGFNISIHVLAGCPHLFRSGSLMIVWKCFTQIPCFSGCKMSWKRVLHACNYMSAKASWSLSYLSSCNCVHALVHKSMWIKAGLIHWDVRVWMWVSLKGKCRVMQLTSNFFITFFIGTVLTDRLLYPWLIEAVDSRITIQ